MYFIIKCDGRLIAYSEGSDEFDFLCPWVSDRGGTALPLNADTRDELRALATKQLQEYGAPESIDLEAGGADGSIDTTAQFIYFLNYVEAYLKLRALLFPDKPAPLYTINVGW